MSELFGLSMTIIMWVLLGFLAVALLSVLAVGLGNRVMFKIGLRNIPRRRAQTILIVIGLMLSSLIISSAFTTGDTVARSLTSQIYTLLGSVDETVQVRGSISDQNVDEEGSAATQRDAGFDAAQAQSVIRDIEAMPNVDAVVPIYSEVAVAINPDRKLSSPVFTVSGVDPDRSKNLPDVVDIKSGDHLKVQDLAAGEIYLTRSGAEDLNVKAGETIVLNAFGKTQSFKVKAIVQDKRLAGSGGISVRREGGVLPIQAAQDFFGAPGRLTAIAISNKGDVRGGVKHSDEVTAGAREIASRSALPLSVIDAKKQGVDLSEEASTSFTTFFLVFGLFSIGAGVLLIFMIFVMLAAERKSEMGMARAVGTKRADIVQTFLSEGMGYNVAAAAVGCLLGVVVAFIIAKVLSSIFSNFNIDISPHVTARSLIVSYSLGVVLTFATVVFSSWRISNINIVRAIRDIPDPPMQRPNWRAGGFLPTLVGLIFRPADGRGWLQRGLLLLSLVLFGIGMAVPMVLIAGLVVWLAVLFLIVSRHSDLGGLAKTGEFLGLLLVTPVAMVVQIYSIFQTGPLFLVLGIALTAAGNSSVPVLMLGLSLIPIGLALLARSFGSNERLTYTLAGLSLLYLWLFDFEFGLIDSVFGATGGGIEMFFLSGLMITLASVFLAVYNADLIVKVITVIGSRFGALVPSLRMASAYPLVNKMRTGMTMAMFCLVIFALIVMSTLIYNFNHVFVSDAALGGWDVFVDENPTNQISDLTATLRQAGSSAPDSFQAVGTTSEAGMFRARLCEPRDLADRCGTQDIELDDFQSWPIRGVDEGFLNNARIGLQTRAGGYDSDEAVWQALAQDPTLAIIDSNAIASGGGFGGDGGFIRSIETGAKTMEPLELTVYDRTNQKKSTVKVIGIMDLGASGMFFGLHVSNAGFANLFGTPDYHRFYVKTKPGTNNREVAREIEASLLNTGAQAESLRYFVDQQSSLFNGFIRIIQGFMGLGLVVGVAAVGVISFRTVVERRQQIGMLRALGYTRGMVGLTFLLESGFIAAGGIVTGIGFGLILARYLIRDEFANQGIVDFVVPWGQVGIIALLSFGSALLMTILPSRQAASIPIAAALRYE